MRYLCIALGIAALHRLVVVGLAGLTFHFAMSAFGGSGSPVMMRIFSLISAALDFPLTIVTLLYSFIMSGSLHSAELSLIGLSPFVTSIWAQLASSLCFGAFLTTLLYLRRKKKNTQLPP